MNSIIGKIQTIGQTQTIPSKGGRDFTKREVIIDSSTYDRWTGDKFENYPFSSLSVSGVQT